MQLGSSGRHTTYTGQHWTQEVLKSCLLVIQHGHWAETTRASNISVAKLKVAHTQHRGSQARFLSGKRQYHRTYQLHALHGFQHMIIVLAKVLVTTQGRARYHARISDAVTCSADVVLPWLAGVAVGCKPSIYWPLSDHRCTGMHRCGEHRSKPGLGIQRGGPGPCARHEPGCHGASV